MVLRADGSASSAAERCGRLVALVLQKHCELKTGGVSYKDFARGAGESAPITPFQVVSSNDRPAAVSHRRSVYRDP